MTKKLKLELELELEQGVEGDGADGSLEPLLQKEQTRATPPQTTTTAYKKETPEETAEAAAPAATLEHNKKSHHHHQRYHRHDGSTTSNKPPRKGLAEVLFRLALVFICLFPVIVTSVSVSFSQLGGKHNLTVGQEKKLEQEGGGASPVVSSGNYNALATMGMKEEFERMGGIASSVAASASKMSLLVTTTGCVDKTSQGGLCCSGDIIISTSITKVLNGAFFNCAGITSVTILPGVVQVGDESDHNGVFEGCTSLSFVSLPTTLTILGQDAFLTSALSAIDLPTSLKRICFRVFYNIQTLSVISIPTSVTYLGTSSFAGCTSLSSISIPTSVITIGTEAFGTASIVPCNTGTSTKLFVPASMAESVYSSVKYSCSVVTYTPGKYTSSLPVPLLLSQITSNYNITTHYYDGSTDCVTLGKAYGCAHVAAEQSTQHTT